MLTFSCLELVKDLQFRSDSVVISWNTVPGINHGLVLVGALQMVERSVPNGVEPVIKLDFGRSATDKVPDGVHLYSGTRLEASRVVKDISGMAREP